MSSGRDCVESEMAIGVTAWKMQQGKHRAGSEARATARAFKTSLRGGDGIQGPPT